MRHPISVGFSFGLTSGIITTLGLLVGLNSGTHSKTVVLGGILTIAVADAFSDAMGIHISEESEGIHRNREIWEATISTFLFKFISATTFVIPVLWFDLKTAVEVSVIWGLLLLSILSYRIAKEENRSPWKIITEHLIIAGIVIAATHYVGSWAAKFY